VDCCDRERPSARRRANRNPFERAKKFLVSSRRGISFLRRDSKDERTKKHFIGSAFSTKSTLWVGEILLRNVKCA